VLGDAAFADEFFRRFIHGREAPDYATLLAPAGLLLRAASAGTPTIGLPGVTLRNETLILAGPVLAGTTLYEAGASMGDRIIAVNGRAVASADELAAVVSALRPGDLAEITYEQRGVRHAECGGAGGRDARGRALRRCRDAADGRDAAVQTGVAGSEVRMRTRARTRARARARTRDAEEPAPRFSSPSSSSSP
jgi:predicted metalloprotease with PDZ domain